MLPGLSDTSEETVDATRISAPDQEVRLCLCSVFRDEASSIEGMIECVAPYVDMAIICDAKSADSSLDVAQKKLQKRNIRYEAYVDEWIDHAHNKNLCLLRVPEWITHIIFLDADERLCVNSAEFKKNLAFHDVCHCTVVAAGTRQTDTAPVIFRRDLRNCFMGRTQPRIRHSELFAHTVIYHDASIFQTDSKSSQISRIRRNLETHLNTKDMYFHQPGKREFVIAQEYMSLKQPRSALVWYKKRAEMKNEDDEREEEGWYAQMMMGQCYLLMKDPTAAQAQLWLAYERRQTRAEPIEMLVHLLVELNRTTEAFAVREIIRDLAYPQHDCLGIREHLYTRDKRDTK